jgi:hypothetical protein
LPINVEEILRNPIATLLLLPFLPFILLAAISSNPVLEAPSPLERIPSLPPLPSPFQSSPRLQNIEEVEWEDWRGRKRRIVIHRRVE